MRWFTTGVALATLLAWGTPGRAVNSLTTGTLNGTGDTVYHSPFNVTLTISPFAEVVLGDFAGPLIVPAPGATGDSTMLGTLDINAACDMAVTVVPITVNRTEGGIVRGPMPLTYTAGPAVGVRADVETGTTPQPSGGISPPRWTIRSATTVYTDSFTANTNGLGAQVLGFDAVPRGSYNLSFLAEFTTNYLFDATALASTVTTDVTVTITPN